MGEAKRVAEYQRSKIAPLRARLYRMRMGKEFDPGTPTIERVVPKPVERREASSGSRAVSSFRSLMMLAAAVGAPIVLDARTPRWPYK